MSKLNAVIDIGSNSVRLLVSLSPGLVLPKRVLTTQLSLDTADGILAEESRARTLAAVLEFSGEAEERGAANTYIFATEAVRSAKNGAAFAAQLATATGRDVYVLSGEAEARLGLLGAAGAPDAHAAVLDIGGASTELVTGSFDAPAFIVSLPVGVVRLLSTAGTKREYIERAAENALLSLDPPKLERLTGIGGTATSLASMYLNQTFYDPAAVHGTVLPKSGLAALTDEIFACSDLTARFPTLPLKRAKVIGHGAVLALKLLDMTGADALVASETDNMEGFLSCRALGLEIDAVRYSP